MEEAKIEMQRDCFAVKACHMMGKSVEEAARLLAMEVHDVATLYHMIEVDVIDFNAGIDD